MSQLCLLLTLLQGKQILLHNKWEIAWVQETIWKLWRRKKISSTSHKLNHKFLGDPDHVLVTIVAELTMLGYT